MSLWSLQRDIYTRFSKVIKAHIKDGHLNQFLDQNNEVKKSLCVGPHGLVSVDEAWSEGYGPESVQGTTRGREKAYMLVTSIYLKYHVS